MNEVIQFTQDFEELIRKHNFSDIKYRVKCLEAAHKLLLEKYLPFKVGDNVYLTKAPSIDAYTRHGWLPYKDILTRGCGGKVVKVGISETGSEWYDVEISISNGKPGVFSFSKEYLALVSEEELYKPKLPDWSDIVNLAEKTCRNSIALNSCEYYPPRKS